MGDERISKLSSLLSNDCTYEEDSKNDPIDQIKSFKEDDIWVICNEINHKCKKDLFYPACHMSVESLTDYSDFIYKKIGEEASETIIAAKNECSN